MFRRSIREPGSRACERKGGDLANFYRLDPDAQREQGFCRLLHYLRDTVYPYHPAFRKACREAGISRARIACIRSYREFAELPLMTKAAYRAEPLAYVLQPRFPGKKPLYSTSPISRKCLARYAIQALLNYPRVHTGLFRKESLKEKIRQRACREWLPIHTHASSGSTGEPTPSVYTHRDLTYILPEMASSLMLRADHPDPDEPRSEYDHRRMNLFPGAPHLAFFQTVFIKTAVGLNVFDTFGGKVIPTDRQIEIFAKGGFNGIGAIPSYLVYWLRRAVEMMEAGKIRPFGPSFLAAALGGEPVSASLREHIHALAAKLGAHPRFIVTETYGSTETKWAALECTEGSGLHLNPRFYFWELLDPATKKPAKPGEPGVLVFSHIDWRGTVFVRYWTGDLVQGGWAHERCAHCGYSFMKIHGPIARVDKDFTKLKGAQVALQPLVAAVLETPGVRNCQIVLDKEDTFGRDVLSIRVLPLAGENGDAVAEAVRANVRSLCEVTPDHVMLENDRERFESELFARNGIKADYVIDRRAGWRQAA